MKKDVFLFALTLLPLTLMAQTNNDDMSTSTSSTIQIDAESAGRVMKTKWVDFDKDAKHRYVVKEDDGYYFFLYDYGTSQIDLFEDKYFIKLFMGKTLEDVQSSYQTLRQWYKKVKNKEYMSVTNPDGQKIVICKGVAYIDLTYGSIDDIIRTEERMEEAATNARLGLVPVVHLINSGERARAESDYASYVREKIADGTYYPTNCISFNAFGSAVRKAKSNRRRMAFPQP